MSFKANKAEKTVKPAANTAQSVAANNVKPGIRGFFKSLNALSLGTILKRGFKGIWQAMHP
jgi:hypothetical protein